MGATGPSHSLTVDPRVLTRGSGFTVCTVVTEGGGAGRTDGVAASAGGGGSGSGGGSLGTVAVGVN